MSALVYVPIGAVALIAHPPTAAALACGATAGVLASVVPFVADVLALRRVPTHFFGIFMSVNPVFAAAIGAAVLAELLGTLEWIAIGLIVAAANVGVVLDHAARDSKWPGSSMTPTALQESSCFSTPNP